MTFEQEVISRLDSLSLSIAPMVADFVRRYFYTNDKATKADKRDPLFKNKLIEYYYKKHWAVSSVKCMLTETELPTQSVIAGHLFKLCWANDCKDRLGFDDINNPRNGLLWFKPLEYAFDNSHICYQFDAQTETFSMKILNSELKHMTFREYISSDNELDSALLLRTRDKWQIEYSKRPNVTQEDVDRRMIAVDNLILLLEKTFAEFEGKSLMVAEEKCFARCLSFQASMARLLALENGWITREEVDSPTMFTDLDEKKKNQLNSWFHTMEKPAELSVNFD